MHVVLSLEPGGMENGVVNLANMLDSNRVETSICCLNSPGAFVERLKSPGIVTCLHKEPGLSARTVFRLANLIEKLQPQIVHTHNLGPLLYALGARLGGASWKLVHGEHAQPTAGELPLRRRVQRMIGYAYCDRIVPVSASLAQFLIEELNCPAALVHPILNGVDTERFSVRDQAGSRKALGLPSEAFVIGQVARFGPYKRHKLLLEAFERLADERDDVYLMFVGGGGSEEAAVTAAVKASRHAQRILLAGYHQDVSPYYRAMDLLVIPSLKEGLANAALEAMATEVPVLTHDACGHADIIQNDVNGFVRHLSGVAELYAALRHVMADRNKLSLVGKLGRKTVVERFSLQRMVDEYAEMYAGALAG